MCVGIDGFFSFLFSIIGYLGADDTVLYQPIEKEEIKNGQWMGVSVKSQGVNGSVIFFHFYHNIGQILFIGFSSVVSCPYIH